MREALAGLIDILDKAKIRRLRLVRPSAIHLTLKFLGDIRADQLESIVDSVSGSIHPLSPFDLRIGTPGAFPNDRSPWVLWVGVDGDSPELAALQHQLEDAMATLGFAKEDRPFSPHLTLGRFREGTPLPDRRQAAEAGGGHACELNQLQAKHVASGRCRAQAPREDLSRGIGIVELDACRALFMSN